MKAEELRIGNLFKDKHSRKIIKVIKLSESKITFDGCFYGEWQAEPIPLTEEILLKCGFEFFDNERIFNNFVIEDFHNGNYYFTAGEGIKLHEKHIEYLHQLQNLYFSLTGEELNVKL